MLSGYELMWMIVMFDLPVGTKRQRKSATQFRHFLLDQGFQMAQFSVYLRFCAGKEQVDAYVRRLRMALPSDGNVQVVTITDKQYEKILAFEGRKRSHDRKNPEQYVLF